MSSPAAIAGIGAPGRPWAAPDLQRNFEALGVFSPLVKSISFPISLTLGALLVASSAWGLRFGEVEWVCPIDGRTVQSKVALSGTAFCTRLDLKRVGPIADPPPLGECPEDGFVWYASDRDGMPEGSAELRQWVLSDEFQSLRAESPHFRLARTLERLGHPAAEISLAYLRAAWDVELRDPDRYRRFLRASLRHLNLDPGFGAAERERRTLLAGDLLRQLGEFEAARDLLAPLRKAGRLMEPIHEKIVAYQMDLIAAGDADPHYVPFEPDSEYECAVLERRRKPRPAELSEAERREVEQQLRRWCDANRDRVFGPANSVQRRMQADCATP